MKTKITFKLLNETSISVLCKDKVVGQIYSEGAKGHTPYPHDDHESTLESIQICGFTEASKIWACGIFHGTKDIVLRFNPMDDEFYNIRKAEYKDYVDACFKIGQPQKIKSFDDWCGHMGHPTPYDMRTELAVEDL